MLFNSINMYVLDKLLVKKFRFREGNDKLLNEKLNKQKLMLYRQNKHSMDIPTLSSKLQRSKANINK